MTTNNGIRVVVFNPTQQETLATCGHDDLMGYFAGQPCAKCVRVNHLKAVRGASASSKTKRGK